MALPHTLCVLDIYEMIVDSFGLVAFWLSDSLGKLGPCCVAGCLIIRPEVNVPVYQQRAHFNGHPLFLVACVVLVLKEVTSSIKPSDDSSKSEVWLFVVASLNTFYSVWSKCSWKCWDSSLTSVSYPFQNLSDISKVVCMVGYRDLVWAWMLALNKVYRVCTIGDIINVMEECWQYWFQTCIVKVPGNKKIHQGTLSVGSR